MKQLFIYKFNMERCIDGDSVIGSAECGFDVSVRISVRLNGCDTPESRGGTKETKAHAKLASEYTKKFFTESGPFFLESQKLDKFGRSLGRIYNCKDKCLNDLLIKNYLAVAYHGQNKKEVKEAHEANRKMLM